MIQGYIINLTYFYSDRLGFTLCSYQALFPQRFFILLISLQIYQFVQYKAMSDSAEICYWQARSLADAIVICFNLMVTLAIGVVMYRYYARTSQKIRQILKSPYIGILFWMVVGTAKNIFSIVVFFAQINGNNDVAKHFQVGYFRGFMILDTIPSITVQTFFLIIPYNMWLGVLKVLSQKRVERSLIEQQFVILFLYYLIIRLVILVIPLIALFVVDDQILEDTNSIQLYFQLVDSLISSFILVFSISFFKSRFNQLKIQDQKQKKRLIFQYTLMVVINFCRFILDLFFLLIKRKPSQCFAFDPYFTIIYLVFATIITHFLPIGVIIKIYHPQQNQQQLQQQALND